MNQLPQIRLNAPFTVRKVIKARAWRVITAIVAVAFVGQTTMLVRALPGQDVGATGAVCPAGDVKYNVGSGYEYTDNSATITIVPGGNGHNKALWQAADGYTIDSVCIKIGGYGGGSLIHPNPADAEGGPYAYDVSHVVLNTHPAQDIVNNPPLGQACGLDIGLVVDVSGSVSGSEMTQMKSALTTFVDAFDGTPTEFSVSKFETNSAVVQSFTADLDLVKSKIQSNIPGSGNGNTNWDSGLNRGFDTFDNSHQHRPAKPDLIVIATDGSPNRWGYPSANATFNWDGGLEHAIPTANTIKTAGTRIVAIGIGGDPTDPDFPNVDFKFTSITGPNIAPPAAIDENADVIKTDFDQLAAAMSNLAKGLCGGKILVQKQFDTNGDGQADLDGSEANALLGGWNFDVNGAPSNPDAQTTDNAGNLEFPVNNGTYSITETNTKDFVSLTNAWCLNGDKTVGQFDPQTRTVSGLTMDTDETISCTFLNANTTGKLKVIKQVAGSDRPASDWQIHVKHDGQDVDGSPQPGSTSGTSYHLPAGSYTVSETGPDGFTLSFSSACLEGVANVVVGQKTTCTLTNTKIPDPIYAINLEKSGPATIQAGSDLTYQLAWSIGGDTPVQAAVITDPIPTNTSFVSADNGGTENAGVVTWNLGTKNPGDNGVVMVTVHVNSPLANETVLTNTACFNTEEIKDVCDDTTTRVQSAPTVTIEKTGPATVTAGNNISYSLAWSVGGNAVATNVVITDAVPTNTSFVSADNNGALVNGVVTWNLGAKNPGDNGTVNVIVKSNVPLQNGTVITNTACIDSQETEQVCDPTTTTVQSAPSMSISKTNSITTFANPGQTVIYTVVVSNAVGATDVARGVVLTDVLPAGFSFVIGGGSQKDFTLGDIAPGASVTTTYVVTIGAGQSAGTYTNTAAAQGSNTSKVTAQSNVEVRVPQVLGISNPDLTITKSVNPTSTTPGQTVTYTIVVTNVSDVTANNLVIVDTLPKGFTIVETGAGTMTWKIESLASGQSVTLKLNVKLAASLRASTYTNVVTLTADDVDKQQAKAKVVVKVPQVAGLATTGVGPFDLLMFVTGLGMFSTGFSLLRRYRFRS